MKKLLVIIVMLWASICNAQTGSSRNFWPVKNDTSDTIIVGDDIVGIGLQQPLSSMFHRDSRLTDSFPAIYDTAKIIAVYLDGLTVKADSCLKITKATKYREEYKDPNFRTYYGNGLWGSTSMGGGWYFVPDYQDYKLILPTKKEIPFKNVICYK